MSNAVMLGFIHANTVATGFMQSILGLVAQQKISGVLSERGTPVSLGDARNRVTKKFLESNADYLWFVDTDIIFPGDTLDRLLAHNKPVVSANYSQVLESPANYKWKLQPLAYEWTRRSMTSMIPFEKYEGLMEVDACGAGCLLIQRDVFEEISGSTIWHDGFWWDEMPPMGEDVSFCKRVADAGLDIFFDADLKVMHQKMVWV